MKEFIFVSLWMMSALCLAQDRDLTEVCIICEDIVAQMEKGERMSATKLRELNTKLRDKAFAPMKSSWIKRLDNQQVDSIDYFLFLPDYIDSLLNNGTARNLAKNMFSQFQKKGRKGNSKAKQLYQTLQTVKAGETAKIKIQTAGNADIAIVAQPFARISVRFFDYNGHDVTGTDPYVHKGYTKATHSFFKNGPYWITILVKNVTMQDICFTIFAN